MQGRMSACSVGFHLLFNSRVAELYQPIHPLPTLPLKLQWWCGSPTGDHRCSGKQLTSLFQQSPHKGLVLLNHTNDFCRLLC